MTESENTALADNSVYKYTRTVNIISNEMLEQGMIYKSIFLMSSLLIASHIKS